PLIFRLQYGSYFKSGPNRVMFLITRSNRPDEPDKIISFGLSAPFASIPTADRTLITDPAKLRDYVRALVAKRPSTNSIPTFRVPFPLEWKSGTAFPNSSYLSGMVVPADERLEHWAQDAVRANATETRKSGAEALRFFQSTANERLVRDLLIDSGFSVTKP